MAATCEKMTPMSLKPTPAICAASPTVPNTVSNWVPDWMPLATSVAATLAASPSPKRGALDRVEGVVHDRVHALRVMAQRLELGLGAFDVQRAVEPALGGQGGEPAADRADRGQSDLADRCERAADPAEDGLAADFDADWTADASGSSMALPNPLVVG